MLYGFVISISWLLYVLNQKIKLNGNYPLSFLYHTIFTVAALT